MFRHRQTTSYTRYRAGSGVGEIHGQLITSRQRTGGIPYNRCRIDGDECAGGIMTTGRIRNIQQDGVRAGIRVKMRGRTIGCSCRRHQRSS